MRRGGGDSEVEKSRGSVGDDSPDRKGESYVSGWVQQSLSLS